MIQEKKGKTPISESKLMKQQKETFTAYLKEAKVLEKEINQLIRKFETKRNLNCWISNESPGKICIDISVDKSNL